MSPTAPKHACPGKGPRFRSCPNVINKGVAYCQDCLPFAKQEEAKYNRERDQTEERHFIHSTQWRAMRELKLSVDPLCEEHLKNGFDVAAIMVHHIKPVETYSELRLVMENLMSLCNDCHEAIEGPERWGR